MGLVVLLLQNWLWRCAWDSGRLRETVILEIGLWEWEMDGMRAWRRAVPMWPEIHQLSCQDMIDSTLPTAS